MYLRCIVSTVFEYIFIINQKIYGADVYKLCLFNLYINMSASIHPVGILISLWQPFYLSLCLHLSVKVLSFYTSTYIQHLSAYRIISLSVSVYLSLGIPKPDTHPFHARVEQSELKTCPRVLTEYTFI
jgi:hypothetical protein